jgi:hypothetical protein
MLAPRSYITCAWICSTPPELARPRQASVMNRATRMIVRKLTSEKRVSEGQKVSLMVSGTDY